MFSTYAPLPGGVVPAYIDVTKASIARVYDAALNGKDNYKIDREVLRQVQRVAPEIAQTAVDNRNFLIRVTRFIASQTGITGSYVAISHFLDVETNAELGQLTRRIHEVLRHSPLGGVVVFRTRAEIEGMLPGLELIKPGLVHCADWRPDQPRTTPLNPVQQCLLGALGRKP